MSLGLLLAAVPTANAVTIVNFNSNSYVNAAQVMSGWSSLGATFSNTVARSPASGYTGPTFYGGGDLSAAAGVTASFAVHTVANNQGGAGGDDPIRLATTWADATSANDAKYYALFLFQQADWLGLNSDNVQLDSSNALTLSFLRATNHSTNGTGARYVIQSAGNYYISDLFSISTGGLYTPVPLSDPSTTGWYAYDPATSMIAIGSSVSFASINSGITAVGFRAELGSTGVWATGANSLWSDFVVNASLVPEPASLSLLALGGLVGLRRRR